MALIIDYSVGHCKLRGGGITSVHQHVSVAISLIDAISLPYPKSTPFQPQAFSKSLELICARSRTTLGYDDLTHFPFNMTSTK